MGGNRWDFQNWDTFTLWFMVTTDSEVLFWQSLMLFSFSFHWRKNTRDLDQSFVGLITKNFHNLLQNQSNRSIGNQSCIITDNCAIMTRDIAQANKYAILVSCGVFSNRIILKRIIWSRIEQEWGSEKLRSMNWQSHLDSVANSKRIIAGSGAFFHAFISKKKVSWMGGVMWSGEHCGRLYIGFRWYQPCPNGWGVCCVDHDVVWVLLKDHWWSERIQSVLIKPY